MTELLPFKAFAFPLHAATRRRAKKDAARLETVINRAMIDGASVEAKDCELGCAVGYGPTLRRPTETEAHQMETWYTLYSRIDVRGCVFAQSAAKVREYAASLIAAADKLDAESRREDRWPRQTPRLAVP